jgi:hypothetical protein
VPSHVGTGAFSVFDLLSSSFHENARDMLA